jgi:hypothetical protein
MSVYGVCESRRQTARGVSRGEMGERRHMSVQEQSRSLVYCSLGQIRCGAGAILPDYDTVMSTKTRVPQPCRRTDSI